MKKYLIDAFLKAQIESQNRAPVQSFHYWEIAWNTLAWCVEKITAQGSAASIASAEVTDLKERLASLESQLLRLESQLQTHSARKGK